MTNFHLSFDEESGMAEIPTSDEERRTRRNARSNELSLEERELLARFRREAQSEVRQFITIKTPLEQPPEPLRKPEMHDELREALAIVERIKKKYELRMLQSVAG